MHFQRTSVLGPYFKQYVGTVQTEVIWYQGCFTLKTSLIILTGFNSQSAIFFKGIVYVKCKRSTLSLFLLR